MSFEYRGWLELREMSRLKDQLEDSLNLNINPHPLASLGKGWGLEFVSSHAGGDDPLDVNVDLAKGRMEWVVYCDEVENLLQDIKRVSVALVNASLRPKMTVGEALLA
jgi:hypothetical protein